jgi:hypothetical protein
LRAMTKHDNGRDAKRTSPGAAGEVTDARGMHVRRQREDLAVPWGARAGLGGGARASRCCRAGGTQLRARHCWRHPAWRERALRVRLPDSYPTAAWLPALSFSVRGDGGAASRLIITPTPPPVLPPPRRSDRPLPKALRTRLGRVPMRPPGRARSAAKPAGYSIQVNRLPLCQKEAALPRRRPGAPAARPRTRPCSALDAGHPCGRRHALDHASHALRYSRHRQIPLQQGPPRWGRPPQPPPALTAALPSACTRPFLFQPCPVSQRSQPL